MCFPVGEVPRAILASSRSTEISYVMPGAANSLFTEQLLAGLRGGITSQDGMIRIFDLFEFLQPRVTNAYAAQHPVFKAELEENFPVVLFLGGQKGPTTPAQTDDEFQYDAFVSFLDQGAGSPLGARKPSTSSKEGTFACGDFERRRRTPRGPGRQYRARHESV